MSRTVQGATPGHVKNHGDRCQLGASDQTYRDVATKLKQGDTRGARDSLVRDVGRDRADQFIGTMETHHKGGCYLISATAEDPNIYDSDGVWGIRHGSVAWIPTYALVAKAGEMLIANTAPEFGLLWRSFYDAFGGLAAKLLDQHPEQKEEARELLMPYITQVDSLLQRLGVKDDYMAAATAHYAPKDEATLEALTGYVEAMGYTPAKQLPIQQEVPRELLPRVAYEPLCAAIIGK